MSDTPDNLTELADGLTVKQRAFVTAYLASFNASEAARQAGYSQKNANVSGPRLLSHVGIQAAIKAALAERSMTADEVLARKTEAARGVFNHPLEAYIDVTVDEDGRGHWDYDWDGAKADGKLALLIEFVRCGKGELTRMLLDAQNGALDALAKAHRIGAAPVAEAGGADALAALRDMLQPDA